MTAPEKKTTIVAEGLARLISSAQTPEIRGLIKPWLEQWQKLEDAAWEVVTLRYLDTAEGAQLDMLGVLLGAPRGNLTAEQFKVRLRAQVIILRAEGVPPQLEQLLVLCCPYAFTFEEHQAATLIVSLTEPVDPDVLDVAVLMQILVEAKAAGVRLELEYSEREAEDDFLFADFDPDDPTYSTPVLDPPHGFADSTGTFAPTTYGGYLSAVLVTS